MLTSLFGLMRKKTHHDLMQQAIRKAYQRGLVNATGPVGSKIVFAAGTYHLDKPVTLAELEETEWAKEAGNG